MGIVLWNQAAETLDGQTLRTLQLTKLRELLVRVYEQSSYYHDKFDRAGVDPYKFTSLEQYQHYPFFDKHEEQVSQSKSLTECGHPLGIHITCDIRDVNRMSASSGTSGTPSFQGHTANDRRIQNENCARMLTRVGIEPGDRVLYACVMSMWVAGLPGLDGLLTYGANVIPIGALVGSLKVAEMARLTRPEAIICTPSFARHMLRKARAETDIDLRQVGIRKVCVYGEPGGSIPEIVRELSEGFGGAEVYDLFGGTGCMNPIFVSCEMHNGLHFIAPDHAYIEILENRKSRKLLPIESGVEGEFVYTGLDRECGPLIRFLDGDRLRVITTPCSCGRPSWRMKFIGRVDDMLLVKGVNVFPSAIHDLVLKMKGELTGCFRILKFSDSPVVEPPLRLKVECRGRPSDEASAKIKLRLENEVQRVLRFKAKVELFPEGELVMEYGATGKAKLIEKAY